MLYDTRGNRPMGKSVSPTEMHMLLSFAQYPINVSHKSCTV